MQLLQLMVGNLLVHLIYGGIYVLFDKYMWVYIISHLPDDQLWQKWHVPHLYDVHAGYYTVSVSYSRYHMQCCRRFVSPPWQPHIMSNYISIISLITIYISISWVISLMTMLHYVVLISLTVINGDIINLHFLLYDHICCSTMPSKSSWWTHIMLCYPHLPEYHLWVYAMSMYHSQMLPCLIILTSCIVLFFVCIIFLTITKEVMLYLHPFKIIMHAVIVGASLLSQW